MEYICPVNDIGLVEVAPMSSMILIDIPESAAAGVNVPVTVKKYRYIFGSSSNPFENATE
ncbi:unannotated protein [freshwater metagenome]|uniref:Unannotated protein n=1 Tax=freshwater metagenome TaxID=449393 RepID=A0A6J7LC56_9ZZZZ